ncbi:MAG TPA: hypothetical protein PLR41_01130 [Alphaproteobacteria bacterium]|nr:hypothetical protein [Alphaproteobacteria bacterium]
MPKKHSLPAPDQVCPKDMEGMDVISPGNMDPLRVQIDCACEEAGVSGNMRIECALASACLARTGELAIVAKSRRHPSAHLVERMPKPGRGDTDRGSSGREA